MYQPYAARMGIWGEPTNGPTLVDRTMGTMGAVQNLYGKQYENILNKYRGQNEMLNAQTNAATQAGRINSTNVQNQTDAQMYPQMQQAKLNQEQQTVKEIMSRTGLNYAQAREAGARIGLIGAQTNQLKQSSSPGYMFDQAYQQYQTSPDGSPRKMYFGGVLNNLMGAPGGMNLGSKKSTSTSGAIGGAGGAGGGGMVPGANGNISLNPLGGSNRASFHQGYYDSPDDGMQTIESPTTASATRNQTRLEAHSEISPLYPQVTQGLKPYQGPLGSLNLMMDSYKASNGDPQAKQKLTNYAIAKRFLPELAAINARQATGQNPGIELTREFQNSMFPSIPGAVANYTIPSDVQAQANSSYLPIQGNAVNSAINQERTGYPTEGAPDFARTPQSFGYFDSYGYHSPEEMRQSSQQPAQQSKENNQPSDADIEYTAKLHGVTPSEVRKRLGIN